jgi:hypothetical protein
MQTLNAITYIRIHRMGDIHRKFKIKRLKVRPYETLLRVHR